MKTFDGNKIEDRQVLCMLAAIGVVIQFHHKQTRQRPRIWSTVHSPVPSGSDWPCRDMLYKVKKEINHS